MSSESHIVLIGPRNGGTTTGVSVAFEAIISHLDASETTQTKIVDTNLESSIASTGRFSGKKALYVCGAVLRAFAAVPGSGLVYLVGSSSFLGFFKDACVIWWCWAFRRPVAVHLHGGGFRDFYCSSGGVFKFFVRLTLKRVARIFVLADALRDQFHFIPQDRIAVVPNGVPDSSSDTGRTFKHMPKHGEPFRFLYLSNMMVTKGYLATATAAKRLSLSGSLIEMHFCGSFIHSSCEGRPIESEKAKRGFETLAKEPQLSSTICFHGSVGGDRKREMLRNSHCLVLPTRYPGEGQPLCILEALSYGVPVIATSWRGIPETIVHESTGILIEDQSTDSVEGAMKRMISMSHDRYAAMSQACRTDFENRFRLTQHLERLSAELESLVLNQAKPDR